MVHFLWLGTLLGLLALACKWGLRRAGAEVRYVIALGWLGVLAAAPVAIAVWIAAQGRAGTTAMSREEPPARIAIVGQSRPPAELPADAGAVQRAPQAMTNPDAADSRAPLPEADPSPFEAATTPVSADSGVDWSRVIVFLPWIWLVGAPLTLAWSITGLAGAERLRRHSEPAAAPDLERVCQRLARVLDLSRTVTVRLCRRIASPVLVGILRPVILVPPSVIAGLSPQQLEMLLLHELAHVRRWDTLVNLLQRIVESLLFFHPMVWLVSRWVRRERELCCDDIVIRHGRDQQAYAETLVAVMQTSRVSRRLRVVAGTGDASPFAARNDLRSRVRRILTWEDDKMRVSRKLALLVVLAWLAAFVCLGLFGLSRGRAQPSGSPAESGEPAVNQGDDPVTTARKGPEVAATSPPSAAAGNREDRPSTDRPQPLRQVVLFAELIEEQDGKQIRKTPAGWMMAPVGQRVTDDEYVVPAWFKFGPDGKYWCFRIRSSEEGNVERWRVVEDAKEGSVIEGRTRGLQINADTAFVTRLDAADGMLRMTVRFASVQRDEQGPYGRVVELEKSVELLKPSRCLVMEDGDHRTWLEIMAAREENVLWNGKSVAKPTKAVGTTRPVQGTVLERRLDGRVMISLGAGDGLRELQQLDVYRRIEGLEIRVERIEVTTTFSDKSLCRVLGATSTEIQKGNRVAAIPRPPVLISESVSRAVNDLKANPENALELLDSDDLAPSQEVLLAFSSTREGREFLFRHYLDGLLAADRPNVDRRLTGLSQYNWVVLSVDGQGEMRSMRYVLQTGHFGGERGSGGGRSAGRHARRLRRIQLLLGDARAQGLRHPQFPRVEFSFVPYYHEIPVPKGSVLKRRVGHQEGGPYLCLALPVPAEIKSGNPTGRF